MADAELMDRKKNPFFRHATAQHFLARRGDRVVGRVAAIENPAHNRFHGDRLGFFGWFDVEPDPEAATALVEAAHAWTKARGLVGLRGPVSYSTNDTCGVLVEGHELPPMLMMPWNRPDYDALLLGAGLRKTKDLVCYFLATGHPLPERIRRLSNRALERAGLTVRTLDMKRWEDEVRVLERIYNQCWDANWGFVPMTHEEFHFTAKNLKLVVDPSIFLVAERAGEAVGVCGPLPDLNEALVGLDGRLFPFGLFRLLARKKRIRNIRFVIFGIVPPVRGKGVDAALLATAYDRIGTRYAGGECGWILEDNERMRRDLENMGGAVTKRYRLYDSADVAPAPGAGDARREPGA